MEDLERAMGESKLLIVTKIAERGNKFEESRQCIASHDYSIVFLPRGVSPGELVRIELIPVRDDQGVERKDARGSVMYRAEWARPVIPNRFRKAVAEEARKLRSYRALPQKEGEAAVRIMHATLSQGGTGFDWYYFAKDGSVHGSRFSPASLLLFQQFPDCAESGLVELLAWLIEVAYYKKRQSGQEVDRNGIPDLSDERIKEFLSAASGLLSWKPVLSQRLV